MATRGLTQKQEEFCNAYVRLGNPGAAYDAAYPSTKRKHKSTLDMASAQLQHPKIKERIAELRAIAADKTATTIEDIARQLDEDRAFARETGGAAAAVSATVAKGKLFGFFVEKKDITLSMRPEEARQVIAAMAAKYLAGK